MFKSNEIIHNIAKEDSKSSKMLYDIFELNPDAISLTRVSDGKIIDCNQAYLNQIGYFRDEVINHTSIELNLFSQKERRAYVNNIQRKKTLTDYEVKVKKKDGSFIYVLYSARFINIDDEEIILSIGHDITKRRQEEQLKQKLLEKEKQLTKELQISNEELRLQQDSLMDINQALKESEEKFLKAFHGNPAPMTLSDEYKFIDVNESYSKLTGYSRDELIGHNTADLKILDAEKRKNYLIESQEKGSIQGIEFELHTKSGEKRIITSSSELIELGGKIRYISFNYDLTELKEREKLSDALNRVNANINSTLDYNEIMNSIVEEGAKAIGAESSLINLVEKDNWVVEFVYNFPNQIVGQIKSNQESPTSVYVARKKKAVAFNDAVNDPRVNINGMKMHGVASVLVAPIILKDNVKGIIAFYHHTKSVIFTKAQIDFANKLASSLSQAIENAEVLENIKISEEKYHSMFNNMLNGFAYCKMIFEDDHPIDFTYLEVNKSFEKLTGLKNVVGKNVSEVIPNINKSDPELLEIYGRVALTGKHETFEMFLESLKMWLSVSVYSPQKEYFVAVFDVITERKRAEEEQKHLLFEVQHKEEELSALIENIVDEVWFCDAHGKIILANAAARKFEKETELENLKSIDNLISSVEVYNADGSARARDGSPLIRALNGEILLDFEEVIVFPSTGKKSHRNVTSAPIKDNNNKITGAVAVVRDITYRKKIEAELDMYRKNLESLVIDRTAELEDANESLKETEEHYLTLFNSIDEGFCTIEVIFDSDNKPIDYRFLEINPAFANQTGLEYAEGKLMRDLAPDHEEYWFEIYGKIALTGEPMRFVNPAKELNRWYDVYAFKIGDSESREVAILFNDITKFKETEEALKLSNIYNRSLIEASLDPLLTIDPNGKITDVNNSTEIITGLNRDYLIGTDFSGYFTEPSKAREGYQKVFQKGILHDYELEIKHNNGHITPVLYNASVYRDNNDEIIGVFAAARDITKLKKAENKLKEYQDTLEEKVKKRTEELAKSNKELEQFAYITSHDLREPLRMITSFLQLLERRYKDQLDQDAIEFIGFAVDGAKRLDNMTNDLLSYSRISSQKRELKNVNFETVLEEALINLKVPIEENNAVITHDPLPIIKGDEQLKVQLFQNIIGNAIKYRSKETPHIQISAKKEKNQYIFSIKDNGIGMSPKHLKKIFTIFQRLHTNEEYEGTGIGLAIAQKIVHQQGGAIWVESEIGKGSKFYFTIPT